MSKKKAGGKSPQHVRPAGKRLGVKVFSGEKVKPGEVLIRQNGTKIRPGKNVRVSRDFTIYSTMAGIVKFGKKIGKKIVEVI